MARKHKDLEFHVEGMSGTKIFKDFDEACAFAVTCSIMEQTKVKLDVVTWSRAAAKSFAGEAGAESYDEDPEASVFNRIIVDANEQGRVS